MSEVATPSPWRALWLTLYYVAILVAITLLHSQSGFATPKFIYQGF
jgi:hypothetical protein